MTTPFTGEIQLFGFNFAPVDWAQCNGAMLQLRQFTTLFSLIGTIYGGDGQTNFQLPNLTARAPCSQGIGPGLTGRIIGESFGEVGHTLTLVEMAAHTHSMTVYSETEANQRSAAPAIGSALSPPGNADPFVPNGAANTTFAPNMLAAAGGNQAHPNQQPFLAVNFCISLAGAYPTFG